MTKAEALILIEGLHNCQIDHNLREDYIGRGMSVPTHAVCVSSPLDLIPALASSLTVHAQEDPDAFQEPGVIPKFDQLRMDSMGKGVVIY